MADKMDTHENEQARDPKEWTLMFYFASDNPLAPGIVSQLKSIKDAGFHPDANVIARFDPHGAVMPTHVFDVNLMNKLKARGCSQVGPPPGDLFVRNLVEDKLWGKDDKAEFKDGVKNIRERMGEVLHSHHADGDDTGKAIYNPPSLPKELTTDQGPQESLRTFLEFCQKEYPARHYVLFILGHGLVVGNDLFLFDENAFNSPQTPDIVEPQSQSKGDGRADADGRPRQALLLTQLRDTLKSFSELIEGKGVLELLGFHSCSMSSLEVAYELKGLANYMIASQGPAFVGSWPYRQILMRVFNNLNAKLTPHDFEDAAKLFAALREEQGPAFEFLGGRLSEKTRAALSQHVAGQPPGEGLLDSLACDLNEILGAPRLDEDKFFQRAELAAARERVGRPRKNNARLSGGDLRRFNRLLCAEACPGIIAPYPKIDAREMIRKIFYYCLYNSLDFQLAGYSFDMAMCDLTEVGRLGGPLRGLSETLAEGLEVPAARDLILLAHWDAQSYWQETYTDLYDFCFRLYVRCREAMPASSEATKETLRQIKIACYVMLKALSKKPVVGEPCLADEDPDLEGVKVDDNQKEVIVLSEFAGPAYQYSRGFSVFFPWSEPTESEMWKSQYEKYQINLDLEKEDAKGVAGTSWRKFLKHYFDKTQRRPRAEEEETVNKQPALERSLEQDLLEVLATQTFNEYGQLATGGPGDVLSRPKTGGSDPTGADCGCASVKNYPGFTRPRRPNGADGAEDGDPNSAKRCLLPLSQGVVQSYKSYKLKN